MSVLTTRGRRVIERCWSTKSFLRSSSSATNQYPTHVGSKEYQKGERVLALYRDGRLFRTKLLPPLTPNGTSRTPQTNYEIRHNDIIGKPTGRLYAQPTHNTSEEKLKQGWRIMQPSFDHFVSLSPRSVTPIYASYSATMVEMLDIHVSPPRPSNDPVQSGSQPLEILEAGTGHGSLTIHLSRAIAAANLAPPISSNYASPEALDAAWQGWKDSRRAIIHTVEFDKVRSQDTAKLIQSFRGGLYWSHIDFHHGDVGVWIEREQVKRQKKQSNLVSAELPQASDATQTRPVQFLDIVVLDLPGVHRQIETAVNAMKDDGKLLVYVPQITQLAACQQEIERLKLPLVMDEVREFGEGISNGRVWEVRFVQTRAEQRQQRQTQNVATTFKEHTDTDTSAAEGISGSEIELSAADENATAADSRGAEFPTMICRPMVGKLTMGGAFVGLWRKKPRTDAY